MSAATLKKLSFVPARFPVGATAGAAADVVSRNAATSKAAFDFTFLATDAAPSTATETGRLLLLTGADTSAGATAVQQWVQQRVRQPVQQRVH